MKEKAAEMFNKALQKLREANNELCRPEEDVVTSLVCSNSHAAIESYLRGFLMLNSVIPAEDASIAGLYEQCKAIRFGNKASKYSRCFDIADSLDTFMRREKIIA